MWDDLLDMAASVKGGHAIAALVAGRLRSSRRQQNALAAAIKEYGALRHRDRGLAHLTGVVTVGDLGSAYPCQGRRHRSCSLWDLRETARRPAKWTLLAAFMAWFLLTPPLLTGRSTGVAHPVIAVRAR